jgi:hypothetical protein
MAVAHLQAFSGQYGRDAIIAPFETDAALSQKASV